MSSSNVPIRRDCDIPGKHAYTLWKTVFVIDEHYVPIKAIGKGAYGVVCSAKNLKTGDKVAIKKISNAFENLTDARRTLRELVLLRQLRHENIIALKDIPKPPYKEAQSFKDVYLVYELMDTDLHQIIRSSQALTDDHFQYFIYQVTQHGQCAQNYVFAFYPRTFLVYGPVKHSHAMEGYCNLLSTQRVLLCPSPGTTNMRSCSCYEVSSTFTPRTSCIEISSPPTSF